MIPDESFFIRKFSSQRKDEPTLNSSILRREEMEEFSKRPTSNSLYYIDHIRDFKAICRGERLVIIRIVIKKVCSSMLKTEENVQNYEKVCQKLGKCAKCSKALFTNEFLEAII
jgi:hypothetical protein